MTQMTGRALSSGSALELGGASLVKRQQATPSRLTYKRPAASAALNTIINTNTKQPVLFFSEHQQPVTINKRSTTIEPSLQTITMTADAPKPTTCCGKNDKVCVCGMSPPLSVPSDLIQSICTQLLSHNYSGRTIATLCIS